MIFAENTNHHPCVVNFYRLEVSFVLCNLCGEKLNQKNVETLKGEYFEVI